MGRSSLYRLFVIFGGLIVVALFAALLAPFFIDWTAYRTAFEREATKIVGQPVHVAGTAKVRILPLPALTFTDLTVGENPDGTPMMTVDTFSMHAELMPFLSGEVKIVDVTLVRPDVSVKVGEDGTVAWTARKELLVDPENVKVEKLMIEDGSFRIEGFANGRVIRGEGFSAVLSAQSLIGPWRIDANGRIGSVPMAVGISTGRLRDNGEVRVKAVARQASQPYRLTLDGPVSLNEGVLGWTGAFEVQPSLEPAVPGEDEAGEDEALPVHVAGQFVATPEKVELPDYRMEVGSREDPYTITGTAHASIRDEVAFTAVAEGRQIDLDRLQAEPSKGDTAANLDGRIAVLRNLANRIPVPAAKGLIDVVLPAVVAGDTVIREVRARVEPDGDGWQVRRFEASLPGNTRVEARGRLGTQGDFGFTGHMLLASRQPTGFAAWLAGKSNAALRRLNRAGFSADVTFSGSQSTFDNLELVLNDATLHGKLQRLAPVKGRPAIVAELTGDVINTDDLVAIYSLTQKEDGAALTNHDLDIFLRAGLVEGMRLTAGEVDARVRVEAGSVSLDRLAIGDFYGARVEGSGRLSDVLERPSGHLSVAMAAEDGMALAQLAAQRFGENRFLDAFAGDPALSRELSAKLEVEARPQGEASKGTLTLSGWAGGTAFALRDGFEGKPAKWREADHDISASFRQPDPLVLARQFALDVTPLSADGPVSVTAELAGNPMAGMKADLSANGPDTDLVASGNLAFAGDAADPEAGPFSQAQFDLDVTLGTKDIDPWLLMAGYPLPGTGEGHPASIRFKAKGEDGNYTLSDLSGTHGSNGFSGEIAIDTSQAARVKATGALSFDALSVPFVGELLLGAGTINGDGFVAGIADSEFGRPFIDGVNADIKLEAKRFDLGGGPVGEAFAGNAVVNDGALSLPQFSASWAGGEMSGNFALRNSSGNAILNTQLNLAGIDAANLAKLAEFDGTIQGRADIGVTLDASGRSFKGLLSELSGSGVFTLKDGVIEGISTGGLSTILAQADQEGFEIKPENVAPIAEAAIFDGNIATPEISGAFTVGRGRLSVRNVRFHDEGGALEGGGTYSPVTGETEVSATLKYDAGDDALSGADPAAGLAWSGTPGAMAFSLDTKALEGFLSLRAFEREQRKVELLQESVLEKQRLQRETVLTNMRMARREAARADELRRLQELQQRMEEERKAREQPAPDAPSEKAASEAVTPVASSSGESENTGQEEQAPADNSQETLAPASGESEPPAAASQQDGQRDSVQQGDAEPQSQQADPAPDQQEEAPIELLPDLPSEGPVPEPAPRQADEGPIPLRRPVVESSPLPTVEQSGPAANPSAPAARPSGSQNLFEAIRRRLNGETVN